MKTSLAEVAVRHLGLYRVALGSNVQFTSILFRVIVGISGGLPPKAVALVSFLEFFLVTLLEIPAGRLADRIGRVPVAVAGFLLTASSLLTLVAAIYFRADVELCTWLLVLDGVLTGLGRPLFSGAVEAFYHDAILRGAEGEEGERLVRNSLTISARYGKYFSTLAVTLAFAILWLTNAQVERGYVFLIGAMGYLVIAVQLLKDARVFSDGPPGGNGSALASVARTIRSNSNAVLGLIMSAIGGLLGILVMGFLIVAVGRASGQLDTAQFITALACFMFGYVSLGWIIRGHLVQALVRNLTTTNYLNLMFLVLLLPTLALLLMWASLPAWALGPALLVYGIFFHIGFNGVKDMATNLVIGAVNRADLATAASLGNIPSYIGVWVFNLYLLFATSSGAPSVSEIFSGVIFLSLLGMAVLAIYVALNSGLSSRSGAVLRGAALLFALTVGQSLAATPVNVWMDARGKLPFDLDAPPFVAATFNSAVLGNLLFTNKSYELRPGHLKSWQWDYRDNSYILELRPGLKFHNGRAVTAEDLEFSLVRGFFSKKPNYFRVHFANLEGIEKIKPGDPYRPKAISGVKVLDSLRVKIKLSAPNPSFLHNLSYSYLSLAPREELNEDLLTWKSKPVGAGPYRVVKVDEKLSEVLLERVGNASETLLLVTRKSPPPSVHFALWSPESPQEGLTRILGPNSDSVITLLTNYNSSLGSNPVFREALSLALDRDSLSENFDYLKGNLDFLPRQFWGRANAVSVQNLKRARAMLETLSQEERRVLRQKHRVPVRIPMKPVAFFDRLRTQLSAIGLDVEFYSDGRKYWDSAERNVLLWITAFALSDVDPILKFGVLRKNGPIRPFSPESDDRFEALYHTASKTASLDTRVESVKALSQYVFDHKLLIPMAERRPVHWFDPGVIESLGEQDGGNSIYFDRVVMAGAKSK